MTDTSQGKFLNSARKIAFKLVRLPSFKVFVEILKKYSSSKSRKFTDVCMGDGGGGGGGHKLVPHDTNIYKVSQLC